MFIKRLAIKKKVKFEFYFLKLVFKLHLFHLFCINSDSDKVCSFRLFLESDKSKNVF